MIRPIYKMGNACLLRRSDELAEHEFGSPELLALIQDMRDTQQHAGGIGIAAPQIGVNKRVVIIEFAGGQHPRYGELQGQPLTVIINPELEAIGEATSAFIEGCLSVPGLRGEVIRPESLRYKYYDEYGNLHTGEDHGMFARVLQHECDHLDGILYPMRMQDISKLAYIDCDVIDNDGD